MTCIVGLVHEGAIYIGGDSAGVSTGDLSLSVRQDRKVFRNGDCVMGFTTSFRMGQLLAYRLSVPKPREGDDVMAFMVGDFMNAVRQCLKDGGFAAAKDGVECGGTFLVGYRGRLFSIYGDYQVGENSHGYAACGCGELIAMGSLHASVGQPPEDRVRGALTAAETFSAGVRGPFVVERLSAA
jgi:ATP-dependent protease HslVU (ClpYQ) peptidase subunit